MNKYQLTQHAKDEGFTRIVTPIEDDTVQVLLEKQTDPKGWYIYALSLYDALKRDLIEPTPEFKRNLKDPRKYGSSPTHRLQQMQKEVNLATDYGRASDPQYTYSTSVRWAHEEVETECHNHDWEHYLGFSSEDWTCKKCGKRVKENPNV